MKILLYTSIVCTLLCQIAFAGNRLPLEQKMAYAEGRLAFELAKQGFVLKRGSLKLRTSFAPSRLGMGIYLNALGLYNGNPHNAEYDIVYFDATNNQGTAVRGRTGLFTYLTFSGPDGICESVNSDFQKAGKNNGCLADKISGQYLMLFYDPAKYTSYQTPTLISDLNLHLVPIK